MSNQLARTIPTDMPYVLRTGSTARTVMLVVSLLPAGFVVLLVAVLSAQGLGVPNPVGMGALFVAAVLLGLGCWWRICRPRLAANEQGLWIYAGHLPHKAIWLPWDAVDRVERSGALRGSPAIVVVPHERDAGRSLGPTAAVEQAWTSFMYGGRLVVRLPAGATTSVVLARLAEFADRHAINTQAGTSTQTRPYEMTPRPPAGMPLELSSARYGRRARILAPSLGAVVVVPGVVALTSLNKPLVIQLGGIGMTALAALIAVGLLLRGALYRGPVFVANTAGPWVCYPSMAARGRKGVFLRWEAIEVFEVVAGAIVVLRIKPRYPWEPIQSQISTTEDKMLARVLRTRLAIAVDPGYRTAADLVSIVTGLANGRCSIVHNP